jgi:hypothetical protein
MPSPNHFHPEFGYVCPTPRFRRAVSVSFVAGSLGLLVGAVGVIAFAQRPEVVRMRTEIATTVGSSVGMSDPITSAAAAAAIGKRLPSVDRSPCATQSWPYLDSKCLLGTARDVRELPDSFAAVPAEFAAPPNAATDAGSARSQSAAIGKKRPKVAHRRERAPELRRQVEPRTATVDPLSYEQWRFDRERYVSRQDGRYDNGRQYDGRHNNGVVREPSRGWAW